MLKNGSDKCSCRWKNCVRFGKCDECIAHHNTHKRYPKPYCRRKAQKHGGILPNSSDE